MAGRKRGRPKKMSAANPERKPRKSQTALDLLHAPASSQTAAPSPQGESAASGPTAPLTSPPRGSGRGDGSRAEWLGAADALGRPPGLSTPGRPAPERVPLRALPASCRPRLW